MNCGTPITVKSIYELSYYKYLSGLTKPYYDPKFVTSTIFNYVQTHVHDANTYLDEVKHCITYEQLFEEFCKHNLDLYGREYEDNVFSYVKKYGKLQKILKQIPNKHYRNPYNLRQWVTQCKYICKKIDIKYSETLEAALLCYYISRNSKCEIRDALKLLYDNNIIDEVNESSVVEIIRGLDDDNVVQLYHNILVSSIILPPATNRIVLDSLNCYIHRRYKLNSTYIPFLYKLSSFTLDKNQDNPIYKQVFAEELQQEKNMINRERENMLYKSRNKYGQVWLSDKCVWNMLSIRFNTSVIDDKKKELANRLRNAKKLAMHSELGYIPLIEYLVILDFLKLDKERFDVIFAETVLTVLFKYGFNIKEDDVMYYLRKLTKLDKHSRDFKDDVIEVIRYSVYNAPPTSMDDILEYGNNLFDLKDIAATFINKTNPVFESNLYKTAYTQELNRARTHVWNVLLHEKGAEERVSRKIAEINSRKKN